MSLSSIILQMQDLQSIYNCLNFNDLPVHFYIANESDEDIIIKKIDSFYKKDVNFIRKIEKKFCLTPLMLAVLKNYVKVANKIIEYLKNNDFLKDELVATDCIGRSVLSLSSSKPEMLKLFPVIPQIQDLTNIFNYSNFKDLPIHYYIANEEDEESINKKIDAFYKEDIHYIRKKEKKFCLTPLMLAVLKNYVKVAAKIIEYLKNNDFLKDELAETDSIGRTVLSLSSYKPEILKLFPVKDTRESLSTLSCSVTHNDEDTQVYLFQLNTMIRTPKTEKKGT